MTDALESDRTGLQLHVVDVLNNRELIVSGGAEAGLQEEDVLSVLGEPTDIVDPISKEVLGQLVAAKVLVQVYQTAEKYALARTFRNKKVRVGGAITDVFSPPKYELQKETLSSGGVLTDGKDLSVRAGDAVQIWEGPIDDAPIHNASS